MCKNVKQQILHPRVCYRNETTPYWGCPVKKHTMDLAKLQKETLKCVLKEVKVSETVETSLQLTFESIADTSSLAALMPSNGQTVVTLFLRNMAGRIDEVTKLIGQECDVLHFKANVLDLTDGEHRVVYTDGYDRGLSALVFNSANLDTTKEDAIAVLLSQLDAHIDDGTYWFDDGAEDKEPQDGTAEAEQAAPQTTQLPPKPQRPRGRR